MARTIIGVETFVVRIARPDPSANGANPPELHGVVEQLRSKQSNAFRGSEQLLWLLSNGLEPDTAVSRDGRGFDKTRSAALEVRP